MLFHLVERDHPHAGLRGLRGEVLEAAFGGDAKEDLLAVLEEPERSPGAEADARAGAERAAEVGDLGDAEAGQGLGEAAEDLVGAAGEADGPPPREPLG